MIQYPLFRLEHMKTLNRVIQEDEYDDVAKSEFVGCYYSDDYLAFLQRNIVGKKVLDVGCGSGKAFGMLPITHALDANPVRAEAARKAGKVKVSVGASEYLPYPAAFFDTVLYLHGFFQARSDYEAVMEANRVLKIGGRFLFDLPYLGRTNLEFGRIFEPRSYIRVLRDFGFEVVEHRTIDEWDEGIALEKIEDFNPQRMRKLQLIDAGDGLFRARNLNENDYTIR